MLETLSPIERHTRSEEGRVYIARLSPYRTTGDRAVDGVGGDVRRRHRAQAGGGRAPREPAATRAPARGDSPASRDDPERRHRGRAWARRSMRWWPRAVELHGADQGHVQLYDRESQRLQIVGAPGVRGAVSRAVRLGGARRSLELRRGAAHARRHCRFPTSRSTRRTSRCAASPSRPDIVPCSPPR